MKQKHRTMKIRFILSAALLALASTAINAQEYEFTTVKENPVTSIKNQYRSGTCWCYSALSFIESEILRTKGQEVDLSEMFVVGKSYHDRAVKYVRLDGHTQPVDTEVITHSGSVNYDNGTSSNGSMKLYVDWLEGEWFHIYTAEQFIKNAKLNGNYVIHEDLDFADVIWPTSLMHGVFTGTIEGNGHTFKNVSAAQTNNSKMVSGLFGQIKDTAKITDLTIENAAFTIQKGARVNGSSFGLLAGQIDDNATLNNVKIIDSKLQIDSNCAFLSEDYSIGLICGTGNEHSIDASGITCIAVGDAPETVEITLEGTSVRVGRVSE